MSDYKLLWKIQAVFMKRIVKGDKMFFDYDAQNDTVAFGDSYHFFVTESSKVYLNLFKIEKEFRNLTRVNLVDAYRNMDFSRYATFTTEFRVKDKGTLNKFEDDTSFIWINEEYLKEFDWFKNMERYQIRSAWESSFKNPVLFEGEDISVVILPVRVGDENGI